MLSNKNAILEQTKEISNSGNDILTPEKING